MKRYNKGVKNNAKLKTEKNIKNIQNISSKDPPHNGGLNGLTGLKEVQKFQVNLFCFFLNLLDIPLP